MNFLEAIAEARKTDKWFRPVGWRRQALTIREPHGTVHIVPNSRGGHHASMPDADELYGEWEVVNPQTVNNE